LLLPQITQAQDYLLLAISLLHDTFYENMGITGSKEVESVYFPAFQETLPSLAGKTVAITGCTSGTGYIVARTSIEKGAKNVLLLNRPSERSVKAETDLRAVQKETKSTTNIETIACDLQDFESVKNAANAIKAKYESVDVLCNNAGIMAMEDKATKDGYDIQMQTNHLSHFLLTKELFPVLQRAKELNGEARIVQHSSMARYGSALKPEYFGKNGGNLGGNGSSMMFGGGRWVRYQQTKLANSVFTMTLKDKLGDSGIKAVVAAPGFAKTNLQTASANDGGMPKDSVIMKIAQSAEDGAMPILAACFDSSTENGDFWEPYGGMIYRGIKGPATKVALDKLTANEEFRTMLWEESEKACGKFEIK
jgi:NAD(P)-dependent dehydrogenase (short-subunit alcohol dehydrogenase family)